MLMKIEVFSLCVLDELTGFFNSLTAINTTINPIQTGMFIFLPMVNCFGYQKFTDLQVSKPGIQKFMFENTNHNNLLT